MTRFLATAVVVLFVLSMPAFGQIIDPNVGFCATPASSACTADPNLITSSTSFGMWSFGGNSANQPWYLLVAVPELTAGSAAAPAITSPSFTLNAPVDAGAFGPSTPTQDIYTFVENAGIVPNTFGSNSAMNNSTSNMFGPEEQAANGGTLPNFFEIFVYEDSTEGFLGNTAYSFSSPGLINGTFIAAIAVGGKNANIQFSTPFTTAGLIDAPNTGNTVPEPFSILLLGTVGLAIGTVYRKRVGCN